MEGKKFPAGGLATLTSAVNDAGTESRAITSCFAILARTSMDTVGPKVSATAKQPRFDCLESKPAKRAERELDKLGRRTKSTGS